MTSTKILKVSKVGIRKSTKAKRARKIRFKGQMESSIRFMLGRILSITQITISTRY